ncbi:hypothetical protein OOK36_52440 [Streptomyces sp. NBC_00365]|uniref:hypothetical protein n=1 Tax=Streptomyces sp. NBC_00365 TaxID=2975726 RepID=UPI00225185DC|nr:hypothetical protein [Streptomyces sp. NBC_00365]MCX5097146.1 hypothetical protein [Streptomyces sp. NBC_00365]
MSIVIDKQIVASALVVRRSKSRTGRRLRIRWAKNRWSKPRLSTPTTASALTDCEPLSTR